MEWTPEEDFAVSLPMSATAQMVRGQLEAVRTVELRTPLRDAVGKTASQLVGSLSVFYRQALEDSSMRTSLNAMAWSRPQWAHACEEYQLLVASTMRLVIRSLPQTTAIAQDVTLMYKLRNNKLRILNPASAKAENVEIRYQDHQALFDHARRSGSDQYWTWLAVHYVRLLNVTGDPAAPVNFMTTRVLSVALATASMLRENGVGPAQIV